VVADWMEVRVVTESRTASRRQFYDLDIFGASSLAEWFDRTGLYSPRSPSPDHCLRSQSGGVGMASI